MWRFLSNVVTKYSMNVVYLVPCMMNINSFEFHNPIVVAGILLDYIEEMFQTHVKYTEVPYIYHMSTRHFGHGRPISLNIKR
jgi:hypothetical protein